MFKTDFKTSSSKQLFALINSALELEISLSLSFFDSRKRHISAFFNSYSFLDLKKLLFIELNIQNNIQHKVLCTRKRDYGSQKSLTVEQFPCRIIPFIQ